MSYLCQDLSYQVDNNSLLEQVSTKFKGGEITAILGKNGAGKSTWLSLLSGELIASSGQLFLADKAIQSFSLSALAEIRSVLPQQQKMSFSMSVEELVSLGAEVQGKPALMPEIVQQVMQACDISSFQKRDVLTLSGGELQRAQLARVLAQIWPIEEMRLNETLSQVFKGRWLLLDEWSNGLDLHHQQLFIQLFKTWAQQGLGIIMVVHDLNLATQVADHIKVLDQGHLVLEGEPQAVLNKENVQKHLQLKISLYSREQDNYPLVI